MRILTFVSLLAIACIGTGIGGCTGSGLPNGGTNGSSNGGNSGTNGGTNGGGGKSCGGLAGIQCPSTEWCDFPDASTCGGDDSTGTCKPRPDLCSAIWTPVCGCDAHTYSSECSANLAGVDIAYEGECEGADMAQPSPDMATPPPNQACGGLGGDSAGCGNTQYCKYPAGDACGATDGPGTCTQRPQACDDLYSPVCGCDGLDYGNACTANAAGTDVAYDGTCTTTSDCRQTGCPSGKSCQLCWTSYACLDPNVVC